MSKFAACQVVRRQVEVLRATQLPKPGPVDRRDPAGAVREVEASEEVVAVARDLRHDLAEAERHDREVVAAQAQRRQADEHADDRRRDARHRAGRARSRSGSRSRPGRGRPRRC